MTNEERLIAEKGRAAVAHFRDKLRLSNRAIAEHYHVPVDAFEDFMNGNYSALTEAQKSFMGFETVPFVAAEDRDREEAKRLGLTPGPGVREVIGFPSLGNPTR